MIPKWLGTVTAEGALKLEARNGFRGYLRSLAGQAVEVTVSKVRKTRSRNQNAFWWGVVVPMFAERCGYQAHEHDAVHDELIRVLVGLKPDANPALKIRQSTTEMDTTDFNNLIEAAQISDPDPEWRSKDTAA